MEPLGSLRNGFPNGGGTMEPWSGGLMEPLGSLVLGE